MRIYYYIVTVLVVGLAVLFFNGLPKTPSSNSYLPPHASTFEAFTGVSPDEYGSPENYILNLAKEGNNLVYRQDLFAQESQAQPQPQNVVAVEPEPTHLDTGLKQPVTSSYVAAHPDQTIARQTENSNRLQSLLGLPEVSKPQTVEGFEGIYSPADYSMADGSIDRYSKFRGSPECIDKAFGLSNSRGPLCVEDEVAYNLLRQRGGNAV